MTSLFKLHKEKDRVKVTCDLAIKKVIGLSEANGKGVVAAWQRGSRISSGHTKLALCANGEAAWDDKFVVQYNLYKSASTDKFDEKLLAVNVTADKKTLYKVVMDLSTYAKSTEDKIIELPLSKKLNGPVLQLTLHTKWLKINDKLLVSQEGATEHVLEESKRQPLGKQQRNIMEMDGTNYALKTDDALTDTSSMEPTSSWDEDDVQEPDDVFAATSIYEAERKKSQDDYEAVKKQLRMVEGESLQRAKTIEIQGQELAQLRHTLASIESNQTESEELVQRAYGVESFMQQRLAVAEQDHAEQIAAVKKTNDLLVADLKLEIEQLKKTKGSSSVSPANIPSLRENEKIAEDSRLWKSKLEEAEQVIKTKDGEIQALFKSLESSQARILELQTETLSVQSAQKFSPTTTTTTTTATTPTASSSSSTGSRVSNPTPAAHIFTNPLLDKYWPFILVLVLYFMLSFDTLFTM